MFIKNCLIVIPTRNRSFLIRKTINNLIGLNFNPKKIVVIDSSDKNNLKKNIIFFKKKKINFQSSKPSISHQRNLGLKFAKKFDKLNYLMFLDDDIYLTKKSLVNMNLGIKKYKNVSIFGFNQINKKGHSLFDKIKQSPLIEKLGLYHSKKGKVLKSGFQTIINNIESDMKSEWISFAATVCKYNHIKNYKFDETFGQYSYLEDLDFSLNLKKNLIIISDAKYLHYKDIERTSFKFGFIEVVNRYKIITKYKLSKLSFYKMILIKIILNFISIFYKNINFFMRLVGNVAGIIYVVFFK